MAFYIITKDANPFTWHVNTPKPKFSTLASETQHIHLLQADGNELDLIIKQFGNLPFCFRICTWRGEMAQFIYDNL